MDNLHHLSFLHKFLHFMIQVLYNTCSKRRFAEQQAEEWWKANQDQVFKKYVHPNTHTTPSTSSLPTSGFEEDDATTSS